MNDVNKNAVTQQHFLPTWAIEAAGSQHGRALLHTKFHADAALDILSSYIAVLISTC